ncbi:winged helix-turn-helix transcriptional regulator [Streptomyces caniscabiei]|uniref:Helix-turn-helix transcriptional regulator n=1 Tax=Streptomyces caniscabiei TaxID=2746961 RepID=A0A927QIS7_9ACTN|nr:helix-turn-helix domain-containing protein [Streptomyces caniscabiei]MBD9700595.1 helix-turn-helix transcriptional regulator [Streptomyces caniscabiei]MBD9727305.1 helix-turn-helix transcriptional regulator [Streptomyces caniscabiei]MDX3512339.1 helix-turn-helix domain-containing protein [Streptomyces caniscabiei]MDX3721590.1 helix-turn-helix domain-containing protein [Streptomyces caniscabiei]MDX3727745.1 helix-turn-helix domain-containing protein [Streptomyces caniscabiei]
MQESTRGNVRNPACPGRQLFDLVTARWAALVLVDLMEGPQRWSELRRRAGGVSDKMLAQTLRDLEAGGLITRTVHADRPPTVLYALTDLARGATAALQHLQNWAEEHTSDYDHYRRTHTIDPKP